MRYKAMTITGKRTWGGALKIMDRMFGIWDYASSEWWKGYAAGRVTYKHYDNAVERAQQLNDGTYVTKYVGKDRGIGTYGRLIDPTDQVSSHWFRLPTDIIIKHRRPWGAAIETPKEFRVDDPAYEFVSRFYRVQNYRWIKTGDSNWSHDTSVEKRAGWSIEVKVSEFVKGDEMMHYHRTEKMVDWLEYREAMHTRLTDARNVMMTDITDRSGCYGNHWQEEPDKEADTWEYTVEYETYG